MDQHTKKILDQFKFDLKVKKYLTFFCYLSIIFGVLIYGFYATKQGKNVKIVTDYKKNKKNYQSEKTMTHPTINYQYNENEIYHIEAKKAFHKNNSEARFYEVSAKGDLGEIVSKELEIDEEGNKLIFSDNPVLILKQHN